MLAGTGCARTDKQTEQWLVVGLDRTDFDGPALGNDSFGIGAVCSLNACSN